nr:MAG TPA: hypothetical protein [Caudoviricetes sp.]
MFSFRELYQKNTRKTQTCQAFFTKKFSLRELFIDICKMPTYTVFRGDEK